MSKNINRRNASVSEFRVPSQRLFLDMDGTIARFHDNILDSEGQVQIELMYQPEFFRTLEPFQNMIDAMKLFIAKHPEVEVYSLSAAQHGDPPGFIRQKDEWLDAFLPEIDREHRIYPECGVAKSGYIPGGISVVDYLIDDFNKNLREWVRDGGKSIKCKNNINHKGTGKFGGNVGNLWTGDMISNLDKPEDILWQLEDYMELEHTVSLNFYEKWFDEQREELIKDLPDERIFDFQSAKKIVSEFLDELEIKKFSDLTKYYKDILLERIDELTYQFGINSFSFAKEIKSPLFTSIRTKKLFEDAMDSVYRSYLRDVDFVKEQIHVQVDGGYYTPAQEKYLFEHVSEVANTYSLLCEEWLYNHREITEEIPLSEELDCVDKAIKSVADKEMVFITGYPIKDNYPSVELDISRRDLQRVLDEVFQEEPWKVEDFLKEYDWDHTDQIIAFIKTHPDFFQDTCKVTDFADAKYAVTITDAGKWDEKHPYVGAAEAFYPERLDEGFAKSLLEKGYEGFHIYVQDLQWNDVLLEGILDPVISEDFANIEKQKEGCLDNRIQKATKRFHIDAKEAGKDKER